MSLARARRRRFLALGVAILAIGLDVAAAIYTFAARDEDPRTAAILRSAAEADARQMALLYGKTGARIFAWFDTFATPAGQAALIALGSAIAAGICFRAAYQSQDAGAAPLAKRD